MKTPEFETWAQAMHYIAQMRAELREAAKQASEGWQWAGEQRRETERLKAENAKLREALAKMIAFYGVYEDWANPHEKELLCQARAARKEAQP